MRSQLLLTGLLFLSSLFLSAQSTISLRLDPSSEDAAVDNWYPNGNYPNETDYCSGTWTINGTQVSWRSFFKFDLSMIPRARLSTAPIFPSIMHIPIASMMCTNP
ncbi:MAG: hypothetical protein IPJ66_00070 [Bacteroidetes bacterium]|nr:hypothetical protein [Bacteroidota bacterium]